MKKGIMTAGLLAMAACTIAAYSWATGSENRQEETSAMQTVSEQQAKPVANASNGKSLVVYFSVPETDGVDASSGASRVLSEGKVMGNT